MVEQGGTMSCGMKRVLAVLLFAAAATPALAQVAGPTPDQILAKQLANQNQFQAQLQANELDRLQRQNRANLGDPNRQTEAALRQQQIQQQIDQTDALRQQMLTPGVDPGDVRARLQQNGAQIQQLQQTQPIP